MKTIAIVAAASTAFSQQLFDAVSELFDVPCIRSDSLDPGRHAGAVFLDLADNQVGRIAACGLPCLVFVKGRKMPLPFSEADVVFADTVHVPKPFRGIRLSDKAVRETADLAPGVDDQVIAQKGEKPIWVRRRVGESEVDLVAFDLPTLACSNRLCEFIRQSDAVRLLPLLDFARRLSDWQPPELRATFMLDDPNLHWRSYGHVNYRYLIEDAHRNNYHVSFATVPMDSWYVHRPTANLFRTHTSRISLLIHGNDHTFFELSRVGTHTGQEQLAAKVIRRIVQLERSAGLHVARVMAPPHGGCNNGMANALLRAGFEAACISTSSLTKRNPDTSWSTTVGLNPAETFGGGLPVIPRYNICWDITYPLYAAFFGQPIIPSGHHNDAAAGCERLQESARFINSLGAVQWMDMQSIARTNFSTRRDGEVLRVRPYARRIRLRVPEGCKHVSVEGPWLDYDKNERLEVIKSGERHPITQPERVIAVTGGSTIHVAALPNRPIDYREIRTASTPMWAVARRHLCEIRDRLSPAADALFGLRHGRRQKQRSFILPQPDPAVPERDSEAKGSVVSNV